MKELDTVSSNKKKIFIHLIIEESVIIEVITFTEKFIHYLFLGIAVIFLFFL